MLTYSTTDERKTGGHPFKRGKGASVNLLEILLSECIRKPVCEGGYGALNCKKSKAEYIGGYVRTTFELNGWEDIKKYFLL